MANCSNEKSHKNVIFQSPVVIYSVIGCKKSAGMVSRLPKSNVVTSLFLLWKVSYLRKATVHSWVTLLHSAAWGFSLSWAAAATKQLLSDAVFQNKQTDQVWWPPRPNCANAGVLKFGVVYSFSPLLAPWLLFFSLHFPFISSQLSNDVQIQLNL